MSTEVDRLSSLLRDANNASGLRYEVRGVRGGAVNERPVTGFCEHCGRTYTLSISEPGSSDLQFERLRDAFDCCIECGQVVGRACCGGAGQQCLQCAQANPAAKADREMGAFAALAAARAAVRQLDGAAAVGLSQVDDAIHAVTSAPASAASGPWEDAWLAAGTLDMRLGNMRKATIALLKALPPGESDRSRELEQELGALLASHAARWRSVTDGLVEAGLRLPASSAPEELVSAASASPSRASTLAPTLAPAIAVAVPLPIHAPDRVTMSVSSERGPHSAAAAVPVIATASSTKAPITVPTKGGTTSPQQTSIRASPEVRPGKALDRRDGPPVGATAVPVAAVLAASGRFHPSAAGPQGAPAGTRVRRRPTAVAALAAVVCVAALGGMLALSTVQLGRDASSSGAIDDDAVGGAGGEPSASTATFAGTETPQTSGAGMGTMSLPPLYVTFDLHPVGPLDPVELPIARIIGRPEVFPFPTAVDRSLRLTGAAGACFELPTPETSGVLSMSFDVHLGEVASDGMLVVVLATDAAARPIPLAIDLTATREFDRDAWYRFEVTSTGDSGQLVVTPVGGDQAILEAALNPELTISPTSTDQACIQSALPEAASVLVDNLRVER